ncbi:MAG TPA: hypothetical protein VNE16_10915 [Vicinamibacterales bacterium]|nr:hypothetical protein [Vicinamibacterales bacterium]
MAYTINNIKSQIDFIDTGEAMTELKLGARTEPTELKLGATTGPTELTLGA